MKDFYSLIGLRRSPDQPAGLIFRLVVIALFAITPVALNAQSGLCDPTTPFFVVDLTASPSGTWTSPTFVRNAHCCGTTNPDRCLEFEITLNPGTIAINFDIATGAVPPGAAGFFGTPNAPVPFRTGKPASLSVR